MAQSSPCSLSHIMCKLLLGLGLGWVGPGLTSIEVARHETIPQAFRVSLSSPTSFVGYMVLKPSH